jgi:hypothetical protein
VYSAGETDPAARKLRNPESEVNVLTRTQLWVHGGLALTLLAVVAAPVFYAGYAIHNDYYAYLYQGCCFPETNFLFLIARPLGAILLNVQFFLISGIEALRAARIAGFGLLFLVFLFTYRKFVAIQPEQKFLAWLAAFLIAILPGFLLNTIWVANHVPGLIGVLVAIWAYYLVDAAGPENVRARLRGYVVLFLSFLIYPPAAYYFLVFTVWKGLFGNQPAIRIIPEVAALAAMSLAYLLFAKFINHPLAVFLSSEKDLLAISTSPYSLALAGSLAGKAEVLRDVVHIGLGLWGADIFGKAWRFALLVILFGLVARLKYSGNAPGKYTAMGVLAVTAAILSAPVDIHARVFNLSALSALCMIAYFCISRRAGAEPCLRAAGILAAFLISMAPIAGSQTGFAAYRNTSVTAAIGAVLFVWALSQIARARARYILTAVLVLVAMFLGRERLEWTAMNASAEYAFLKEKIDRYQPGDGVIVIKQPPNGSLIFPLYVYRDFRLLTTNVNAVSHGIVRGLLQDSAVEQRPMPRNALSSSPMKWLHVWIYPQLKLHESAESDAPTWPVVWAYRPEDGFEMDNRFNYVIDMTQAGFPAHAAGDGRQRAVIDVSPKSGTPPVYAFGHDTRYFWSSVEGYPVLLSVRFDQCRQIGGYEIVPRGGVDLTRFPKKWVAEFENDRSREVSTVEIEESRNENFKYLLSQPGCYSHVNFRFMEGFDARVLDIGRIRFHP